MAAFWAVLAARTVSVRTGIAAIGSFEPGAGRCTTGGVAGVLSTRAGSGANGAGSARGDCRPITGTVSGFTCACAEAPSTIRAAVRLVDALRDVLFDQRAHAGVAGAAAGAAEHDGHEVAVAAAHRGHEIEAGGLRM